MNLYHQIGLKLNFLEADGNQYWLVDAISFVPADEAGGCRRQAIVEKGSLVSDTGMCYPIISSLADAF